MSTGNELEYVNPFRFSAASYLCWWLRVDRDYFGWNDLSDQKLIDFLKLYNVRRTIPGKDLSEFISIIRQQRDTSITENSTPTLIDEICKKIEKKYDRKFLSAVSKILWMAHGHPIAIYDNFARTGLEQKVGKDLTNYQLYYQCWLQEFSICKTQIRAAQAWLPESILVARLERYGVAPTKVLRSWIRQPWFANRIFDQYLMHIGRDGTRRRKRAIDKLIDVVWLLDPAEAGI